MAFDAVPGGDPRGPWCPKCARTIQPGEPTTLVHPAQGEVGESRPWHAECARPLWDKITPLLDRLNRGFGG